VGPVRALDRIEIDGQPPTVETLVPALVNYGHVTVMQVRGRRTRGLDLHLARLDTATQELWGEPLDRERVRWLLRHALGGDVADASLRALVFWPGGAAAPSVLVALRPPVEMPQAPQALRSVAYQRPVPHVKHVGSFGQIYHGLAAERDGYDDALLTAADGTIAEAAICNVAFVAGDEVVWPDGPALEGITMLLLEPRLGGAGLRSRRAPVRLADLDGYDGAFVTNSRGVAPVGRIDGHAFAVDDALIARVRGAYESVPWDEI
jgi:branched-subunit amino acid aminotransferase/4-amino-4-deoxychorismate lyase